METKPHDTRFDKLILTDEQTRCVINAGQKSLIIEGKDKTGKSLVLMRIYAKLLESGSTGQGNKISFFESVSDLDRYINDIYEEFVAENIIQKMNVVDEKGRIQIAETALNKHKNKFGRHRFHSIDAKLWLEEFDWIRGMNIDQDEIDAYLMLDHSDRDEVIRMNPADRVIAFQIFSIYCEMLKDNEQIDASDQALFLYRHNDMIKDSMKVNHVLMDNGQQLTKVQAALLGMISKCTVIVTVNRPMSEVGWGPKDIGNDVEICKLTINKEPRKKVIEEKQQEDIEKKNTSIETKKEPQEKRKYTIDTSKARSGSLFRQLREKDGARNRLADGLNREVEEHPKLDKSVYDKLVEEQTLSSFVEAFKMLRKCMITRKMDDLIKVIVERIDVLEDSMEKYQNVYQPDIFNFCDYYIPEILRLAETYLDYTEAGVKWKILHDNEMEIVSALDELLVAVNDKIDEIYRFASIELEAQAKAVESIMNQNGFVKPEYKI